MSAIESATCVVASHQSLSRSSKGTSPPDFVIAGAPKCGTTALYQYLQMHPRLLLCDPKEPHYFADDLLAHRTIVTRSDYLNLFQRSGPDQLVGEASAWYLHSQVAIPQLLEHRPDVKLIVMLRQPVELLRSLHSDLCWVCFEDESDFETAWSLQAERRDGKRIPKLCQVPWFLQYRDVGSLGAHVERLFQYVQPEQVKLILFDDFCKSTQQVYEDVLSFLDIPQDGRTAFPRVNVSKRNRSQLLAKMRSTVVQSLPRPIVDFGKKFGLGKLSHQIASWNTTNRPSPRIRDELRQEITAELSDDIDLLSRMISRDLSHWKQPLTANP